MYDANQLPLPRPKFHSPYLIQAHNSNRGPNIDDLHRASARSALGRLPTETTSAILLQLRAHDSSV